MGAWPAHVHVDPADLPALARLVPRAALSPSPPPSALWLATRAAKEPTRCPTPATARAWR